MQVICFVIRFAILPHLPDDDEPTVRQDAIGVRVGMAVGANLVPIGRGSARLGNRSPRELLGDAAELFVAAMTKQDQLSFSTARGDWARAR